MLVWPFKVVFPSAFALAFIPLAQYAAQAPAHPAVYPHERALIAVFEVFKPAPKYRVEMPYDGFHAVTVGAFRQGA